MIQSVNGSLSLLALLLACGIQAESLPALAAAPGAASIAVRYDDLDLRESRNVRILYHRIEVAAGRLCGPRELGGPDIDSKLYADCVSDAIARAIAAVDRPALSAYHNHLVRR